MFAASGACVWGPLCRVPATRGHFCEKCATCAHSACTYTNVCTFDERRRAHNTGEDPASVERQYASEMSRSRYTTPQNRTTSLLPRFAGVECGAFTHCRTDSTRCVSTPPVSGSPAPLLPPLLPPAAPLPPPLRPPPRTVAWSYRSYRDDKLALRSHRDPKP